MEAIEPVVLRVSGGRPLNGEVQVAGSSNATIAHLAAALLTNEQLTLRNVPIVNDVEVQAALLAGLGCEISRIQNGLRIQPPNSLKKRVPPSPVRGFRPILLFAGALLARNGFASIPLPGSSENGPHPIDLHIKGFKAMGARARVESGRLIVQADRLHGADIYLDYPSVGATENLMMAATGAYGRTIIRHAARDPEVVDLANLLVRMGARIRGAGTDIVSIDGGVPLRGAEHHVVGDRHEAAFYLLAALATGGEVFVSGAEPVHLLALLAKLAEMGAIITQDEATIHLEAPSSPCAPALIRALPYPGFPSDFQLLLVPALASCEGTSILSDLAFPARFGCLEEFRRLGIRSEHNEGTAVLHGADRLTGASVRAEGPLSAAALLVALLAATGEGELEEAQWLRSRYENFLDKLRSLGAVIEVKTK